MIHYVTGNLLDAKVEALVNTVNEVGTMGKGIALLFRDAFPANAAAYRAACRDGDVRVGRMFVTKDDSGRWIINFPTKEHWSNPSRFEWILDGLVDLRRVIIAYEIKSIAIPALGCGNGGLEWKLVRPAIKSALSSLSGVEIFVFEPL